MRVLHIILWCLVFSKIVAQNKTAVTQKATLNIEVVAIEKIKGHLLVAVFNHESKFLKDFTIAKRIKIEEHQHALVFEDLSYGTYAVSIFQDVNDNNQLDSNFLGIPKEPYGFSNNPSTFFGPPSFKKAAFKIEQPVQAIKIKL